jgi:hypothetical protein
LAEIVELLVTDASEDKLWAHGIRLHSALEVLDGDYKTLPDPRHRSRRFMIGPDATGRLLTLVIEPADNEGNCLLITGWLATDAEQRFYDRPGGTRFAGRPTSTD